MSAALRRGGRIERYYQQQNRVSTTSRTIGKLGLKTHRTAPFLNPPIPHLIPHNNKRDHDALPRHIPVAHQNHPAQHPPNDPLHIPLSNTTSAHTWLHDHFQRRLLGLLRVAPGYFDGPVDGAEDYGARRGGVGRRTVGVFQGG